MASVTRSILLRFDADIYNQDDTSHQNAVDETTADAVGIAVGGNAGFSYNVSEKSHVTTKIFRLDIRKYKGSKVNSLAITSKGFSVFSNIPAGEPVNLEIRSHNRANVNGQIALGDHYTPTELTNAKLYATRAWTSSDEGVTVSWTLNGSLLLNDINAALDGDGILDFIVCVDLHRLNTPPTVNNESHNAGFYMHPIWTVSPYDQYTKFDLTMDDDLLEEFYTEVSPNFVNPNQFGDIFRADRFLTDGTWAQLNNGTGTLTGGNFFADDYILFDASLFSTTYWDRQLFLRWNLSGIDTTKQIKQAFLVLHYWETNNQENDTWQIRRYDWTTGSSSLWRTGTQVAALDLLGQFELADLIANGNFPQDVTDDEDCVAEYIIELNQTAINQISSAPSEFGICIHTIKKITGVAPTTEGNFARSVSAGRDRMQESTFTLQVRYDDGSDTLMGSFF